MKLNKILIKKNKHKIDLIFCFFMLEAVGF